MVNGYKAIRYITTIVCLAIGLSLNAQVHSTISGTITTRDNRPAAGVNVGLAGTNKVTITSENGEYIIRNVKPGTHLLRISFIGFAPQEKVVIVESGQDTRLDYTLVQSYAQLADVVITSTKSVNKMPVSIGKIALDPMDMPQSIAVINSQTITDQQASKLSDVIKNVNGVSLGTTRGSTSETFFARGYNLGANNIMKNGSRSNSAVIPEASTLEKVEVLKGSAALLYGNVSSGAVINMVTKKPKFEYGGEVSLRTGSYNLIKPIGDIYGPISKNAAFRLIGTYEDSESFRNSVTSKRYYVNPSLLYKINPKTELLLQGDYLHNDFTPDFGIGSLDGKIPTTISRSSYFNTPWAYNNVRQATTNLTLNHELNNSWRLDFGVGYQLFKRDYFSTERIQAKVNGDWTRALNRIDSDEDYYTAQFNLTGKFATKGVEHTLLAGTDAEQYINENNAFNIPAYDIINILDPSKYEARTDIPSTTLKSVTETPTYRLGVYVQDLISFSDKFKVLAGLRYSFQEVGAAEEFNISNGNVTKSGRKFDRAFSPRFGVVYKPVKNTSLFASYSNNFSPNSGRDVFEQNLRASIIDQYEAGIKNDFFGGKLSANLTVYKIVNHDLAVQAQFMADGTTSNDDRNVKEFVGETTSDGVEIDLSGPIVKGLNFMAGYSYNFMRYTKNDQQKNNYVIGQRLVGMPGNTANATLFYTFSNAKLKGLKLGASGFYTGERNAGWNNTNANKADGLDRLIPVSGFTTFDFSAGYTIKKLSLLAKVSNITDELNYYVHENYSINPIPPRQFVTTISYKF